MKAPNKWEKADREGFREEFNRRPPGPRRGGRVGLLWGGLDWVATGVPPNDAQFLETRKFQIIEICRWFNIAPHLLRISTGPSRATTSRSRSNS